MVGVRPNLLACGSQPISKLRFCPEVRGRRRGPRFPRGRSASRSGSRGSQRARSPLPRPASPRPLSRPPAEESAGARQFLPRGGRERLRDPSHLTHSHTHTHNTHTHSHPARARARFPGCRHRSLGHWAEAAHTHSRGSKAARGPPPAQKRAHTRRVLGAPGPGAVTHRGCAPGAPKRPSCTWSTHRQGSRRPAQPEDLSPPTSTHTPHLRRPSPVFTPGQGFQSQAGCPRPRLLRRRHLSEPRA